MKEQDLDYLLRRANEEMDLAQQCGDDIAAKIHRELAALYTKRLIEIDRNSAMALVQPITAS